jgi:hypothetical protein
MVIRDKTRTRGTRNPEERMFGKRRRTQPESNSIQNQDLKERLHLGGKRNVNETLREALGLEIRKKLARSSIRIRRIGVSTLWRGLPPLK